MFAAPIGIKTCPIGPTSHKNCTKTEKNLLFHKNRFFDNFKLYLGGLGCPGGAHGPYEAIPSNFGGIWSYMAWGGIDVHVFWKYWKLTSSPNTSKLVLGPPGWSSDFFESQGTISGAIKQINFPIKEKTKKEPGKTSPNRHLLMKWLTVLCIFFGPYAPAPHGAKALMGFLEMGLVRKAWFS